MSVKETIHARIKRLRIEHDLKQQGLADKVGVIYQAVQAWESRSTPTTENLTKLATVFGVSVQYLLTGSNVEEEPDTVRAATLRPIIETLRAEVTRLEELVAEPPRKAAKGRTEARSITAAKGLERAQLRIRKKQGKSSP